MSDTANTFIYAVSSALIGVIVGWALTVVSKYIDKHRETKHFKNGLSVEFYEIKIILALLAHMSYRKTGESNRDILSWLVSVLNAAKDLLDEREKRIYDILVNVLSRNDEDIRLFCSPQEGARSDYLMKTIRTPFLDSNIGTLPLIEKSLRNSVMRIYRRISNINEEMERHNMYFWKTFDSSMTDKNHEIVRNNIHDSYGNIAIQAKIIVDEISAIEKKL